MAKIEAIIMDLDGVLMDSEKATYHIWRTLLLSEFGVILEPHHYLNYTGNNSLMFEEGINHNFPQVSVEHLSQVWSECFEKLVEKNDIPMKAGFEKIITISKTKGLKRAIATSNTQEMWLAHCDSMLDFGANFDVVVTGKDVDRLKPYPDGYLLAAKKMNVNPNCCLAVEDSAIGISAAVNAGMKVIRIKDIAPVSEQFEKKCIASFDHLDDVAEYLVNYL